MTISAVIVRAPPLVPARVVIVPVLVSWPLVTVRVANLAEVECVLVRTIAPEFVKPLAKISVALPESDPSTCNVPLAVFEKPPEIVVIPS